jgi:hypothetical protein
MRHDFCFVISGKLNETMIEAMCEDLRSSQFNCDFRQDKESEDKNWFLLIGMNREDLLLLEAETQKIQC